MCACLVSLLVAGILGCMSEHDETGSVQVAVDTGEAEAKLVAVAVAEAAAELSDTGTDVHVITLRGAEGFELQHLAGGCPADCAVGEAASRIGQAMCYTLGRWTCDVAGAGLVLVERIGD